MKRILRSLAALSFAFAATAGAQTLPSARAKLAPLDPAATLALPAADHAKLLEADAKAPRTAPLRYATPQPAAASAQGGAKGAKGRWDTLPDGREVWRLAIHSPGAIT